MTQILSPLKRPLGDYISTLAIEALAEKFGWYLEKVSPTQKCLMSAVLADHLAGGSDCYTITDSLHCIDPDGLLEAELSDAIVHIANENSNAALADLLRALADMISNDIAASQN